MRKRKVFEVKFCINYPSGKKWIQTTDVTALSEQGAIEIIKWLKSSYNISILSVIALCYTGNPIRNDFTTLGDF